jgi:hypothetical protein
MKVMAARLDDNDMLYIRAWDFYNESDRFRYCHVTGFYPGEQGGCGYPVQDLQIVYMSEPLTHIGDFANNDDPSDDHLHFETEGDYVLRNPLWDSPDYPHLPYLDSTPPTVRAMLFMDYSGPYSDNRRFSLLNTSDRTPVEVTSSCDVDIIVWTHDDGNKVGVRSLSYAIGSSDPPNENDWIPFCDFTEGLPSADKYSSVYAFEQEAGQDVLTTSGHMWYIVTNTPDPANPFEFDEMKAWHTPPVPSYRKDVLVVVWIKAVDAAGNVATDSTTVRVVPNDFPVAPATLRVTSTEHGALATWTRGKGPCAATYRLWMRCGGSAATLMAEVEATKEGESRKAAYSVETPNAGTSPDCTYELEAVMEDGSRVALAWAKAIR